MDRVITIFLLTLFLSSFVQAANVRTTTQYDYVLIPENSYFEVSGGPIIVLGPGEEPPQSSFSNVSGKVTVTLINDYFDTLLNGEPREPVSYHQVEFQFSELSIPRQFYEGTLYSKQSPFILDGDIISGERLDPCEFATVLGNRCIRTGGGLATQFSGEWSPEGFSGSGVTAHFIGGVKFSFSIEASPVPLPGNLPIVSVLTALMFRIRTIRLTPKNR